MPKDLKNSWKETGVSLGHAFRDLGKTILKSGAVLADKVDDWVNEGESRPNESKTEAPSAKKAEQPAASKADDKPEQKTE